jgi:hypothetical protein
MWALYITNVISQCYSLYKVGTAPQIAAQVVENLGTDEDYGRLMEMPEHELLGLINQAHQQYVGGEAPPALLDWVKQVIAVMHAEEEEEEAPKSAEVTVVDAVPEPAKPVGGPVPAPSDGAGPVEPPQPPSEAADV